MYFFCSSDFIFMEKKKKYKITRFYYIKPARKVRLNQWFTTGGPCTRFKRSGDALDIFFFFFSELPIFLI